MRKERTDMLKKMAATCGRVLMKCSSTILVMCVIFTAFATAAGETYTTAEDPLVSLSYVNAEMEKLKAELKSEMEAYVRDEIAKNSVGGGDGNYVVFTTETLKAGQKIVALGACDIILLTGSAKAVCPTDTQRLTDKTTETSIPNNGDIIKNHYVLLPKADGRGICCTSSGTEIMIKGEYKIIG